MKLLNALQTALRAARVPGSVAAKVMAEVEEALARYKIARDEELFSLPDWNLWLVLIKSIVSPLARRLREEGYCHAVATVLAGIMVLDERAASMIRDWVRQRCGAGLDPCCKNPPCCNLA